MPDFNPLVNELRQIIGDDHVVTSGPQLTTFCTSTMSEQNIPHAVLSPASELETLKIVNAFNTFNANRHGRRAQLHPISSGSNWGYTCSEPGESHAFLLYLGRLNKISDYDPSLGTVRIQAGVTQKQLYHFLIENGLNHWMDATGSSVNCSILANSLERGFGHTPAGNHFEFISDLDIILGNGETISTGFRQFSTPERKYHSESVYKWGVGPYIDGLFSQSTLGIVTSATLSLMPAPDLYLPFFITTKDKTKLFELTELLRNLRERFIVRSCIHITNLDKSLQAALDMSDWPLTIEPIDEQLKGTFAKSYMLNEWTASGALYGSKQEINVWKSLIKKTFKGKGFNVQFISETQLKVLKKLAPTAAKLSGRNIDKTLNKLESLMKLKRGEPTNDFLPSVHYKLTSLPDDNDFTQLERNNVGLIWLAPIAPAKGEHAVTVSKIVSSVLSKFNIESAISMTLLTPQTIDCVISLLYDRRIEGADETAESCHNTLVKTLSDAGYLFYRFNSFQHRDFADLYKTDLSKLLKRWKEEVDPNQVLAGGRYGL